MKLHTRDQSREGEQEAQKPGAKWEPGRGEYLQFLEDKGVSPGKALFVAKYFGFKHDLGYQEAVHANGYTPRRCYGADGELLTTKGAGTQTPPRPTATATRARSGRRKKARADV
mgnify:CR=1 FL=1